MHWVWNGDLGPYAGGGDILTAISTVSSNVVVGADRPVTIVVGGTPIGIGDRCPAVPIWGSGGGTAIPELPIKGVVNSWDPPPMGYVPMMGHSWGPGVNPWASLSSNYGVA